MKKNHNEVGYYDKAQHQDPKANPQTPHYNILRLLITILPAVLFFSYYPIISLGETSSMHLELSLSLIWLTLFTLVSLPLLPISLRHLSSTIHSKPLILALFAFPLYLTISMLWSENKLRTLLTAGIFWCLIITILTIPNIITKKNIKKRIVKAFLATSVLVAIFCWIQCILDILNISPEITLLCKGCTYRSFGFPHPNGFAIEPQFMGNLLLAPCFLALYLVFETKSPKKPLVILAIFLVSTLFLTFSRGAIYAFLLGLIGLIFARLLKTKNPAILLSIPLVILSFLLSLLAQGIFAELSPTNDTFLTGINKVINHLTLGHLDFGPATPHSPEILNNQNSDTAQNSSAPSSVFSGYVSESTEVRVGLTSSALALWSSSPKIAVFGVGLGSAGVSMYNHLDGFNSEKEIVQNEYASLLLETGIIGCLLLITSLIIITIQITIKIPSATRAYFLALELAFAATLFFFSGLPNALHTYLLPPLLLSCLSSRCIH